MVLQEMSGQHGRCLTYLLSKGILFIFPYFALVHYENYITENNVVLAFVTPF